MEFARALSAIERILARTPAPREWRDVVNERVKHREEFRPFAPAAIAVNRREESTSTCRAWAARDFMAVVVPTTDLGRKHAPRWFISIGSARIQTVERQKQCVVWKVIDAFGRPPGVPICSKTSFKVRGDGDRRTRKMRSGASLSTDIDLLALENYLVSSARAGLEGGHGQNQAPDD